MAPLHLPLHTVSCETLVMRYLFAPFLVLAIAFIALGASGQRVFIYIGIALIGPGRGYDAEAPLTQSSTFTLAASNFDLINSKSSSPLRLAFAARTPNSCSM